VRRIRTTITRPNNIKIIQRGRLFIFHPVLFALGNLRCLIIFTAGQLRDCTKLAAGGHAAPGIRTIRQGLADFTTRDEIKNALIASRDWKTKNEEEKIRLSSFFYFTIKILFV
jgi:hypothetical protein